MGCFAEVALKTVFGKQFGKPLSSSSALNSCLLNANKQHYRLLRSCEGIYNSVKNKKHNNATLNLQPLNFRVYNIISWVCHNLRDKLKGLLCDYFTRDVV